MASLSEGSRQPKPGVASARPRWLAGLFLLAVLVVAALFFLVVLKAQ
jgi:hypothetical protein